MEVKGSRAQGRPSRDGVRKKRRANARADGQKPDRGARRRASWPMTAKSISIKGAERRSGGCVRKAVVLTSGELDRVPATGLRGSRETLTAVQKSAEGVVARE